MGGCPDLLARAVRGGGTPASSASDDLDVAGSVLRTWTVPAGAHPTFSDGVFTAPRDALYAVYVRVTTKGGDGVGDTNGKAEPVSRKRKRTPSVARTHVHYVLRIEEETGSEKDEDRVGVELMDVGSASFGEVLHLRKGARVMVLAMTPGTLGEVEFKVELVMRKRKPVLSADDLEEQGLSAKELKKRAKKKRRMERRQIEESGDGANGGEGSKNDKGEENIAVDGVVEKGSPGKGEEEVLENPDAADGGGDGDGDEEEDDSGEDWEGGFSSDGSN